MGRSTIEIVDLLIYVDLPIKNCDSQTTTRFVAAKLPGPWSPASPAPEAPGAPGGAAWPGPGAPWRCWGTAAWSRCPALARPNLGQNHVYGESINIYVYNVYINILIYWLFLFIYRCFYLSIYLLFIYLFIHSSTCLEKWYIYIYIYL